MIKKAMLAVLVIGTVCFHAGAGLAQEQTAELPTGFMIEGVLAQQLFTLGIWSWSPTLPRPAFPMR